MIIKVVDSGRPLEYEVYEVESFSIYVLRLLYLPHHRKGPKKIMIRLKSLTPGLVFTGLLLPLAFAASVHAQSNPGAKYGARNPFVCASKKEPLSGSPSGTRLKELV